jgi:hypothetical protein
LQACTLHSLPAVVGIRCSLIRFQPADELPAQRISPVPALTGERSKPFNFKVLSDVSGLTEKYGRDKICTWKAIGA